MAANIFQAGGVDSNWGTVGNWSLAAVPTASDGNIATFDGTSPACTVNTSSRVCNALDFGAYTNTITMTQQITSSGSVTLGAGMTIAGTGTLILNATATLTSNGKVWPNAMTLTGTATYTLADNWDVDGLLTPCTGGSATATINGFQIAAGAGMTVASTSTATGTTLLLMNGTGTMTTESGGALKLSVTINTAGTITFAARTFFYKVGTFTYVAGTVVTTGSALSISATCTLAVAGITWNDLEIFGTITVTLGGNLNVAGLLTLGLTTATTTINGSTINASGSFTNGNTTGTITGTTLLLLNGTGTVTGATNSSGGLRLNTTINTAGTITFANGSIFFYSTGTLTYVAGTVVTTGATLGLNFTGTLAVAGITWTAVNIYGNLTATLTENLTCTGLLTIASGATITTINGFAIYTSGGIRYNSSGVSGAGTTVIHVVGTCTLDNASTGTLLNPITLNAPGGTISITSGFRGALHNLSRTAGTIVASAGNTWASGGGVVVPTSIFGVEGVQIAA